MTNRKSTRRALLMSSISLLLCVSMLVGTTFAWFTDSVTSGVNQIVAGNLDVEVYYGDPADENSIKDVAKLFDDVNGKPILWEPGAVAYEKLTVANLGSLALKYQMSVTFDGATETPEGKTLADVLKVAVVDATALTDREAALTAAKAADGALLKDFTLSGKLDSDKDLVADAETSKTYGVVIYWEPGMNDNDFNMNNENRGTELSINLGIKLVATQLTAEEDSWDETYDENAWADGMKVFTANDLQAAINNGETNITLMDDIETAETIMIPDGATVALNLNGKTITGAYQTGSTTNHIYAIENKGTLTLMKGTINSRGIKNYGTMTLESGTINAIDGNGGYGVVNYAGAAFIMNGGTIATTLEDDNKVDEGGYDATTLRVENGATFEMNGGVINNICDFTFAIDNAGTTTINAGEVSSVHTTVGNHGTLTVNGGEFACNGVEGETQHVIWASVGTATINGGTFDGKDTFNGFNVDASAGATVTINGGNFLPVHSGSLYGEGTITVYGGTFANDVSNRVAENRTVTDNGDGTWTVGMTKSDLKNSIADAVADAIANGESEVEIDANGADIGGLDYGLNTSLVPADTTVTIKNAVISGQSYGNAIAGTVVFENCEFNNPNGAYSIHFDDGGGDVVFKNCTLAGWCSYGSAIKSVKMYNCTLKHNGIYGKQRFYQPVVMEDCVFESTMSVDADSNCAMVVNNCTVDDGSYITDIIYVDDCFTSITIDGKETIYTQEAFNAAQKANATIYLIGNDTGVVYDLKNNMANGLTIIGLGDDVKMVNNHNYASGGRTGSIMYAINLQNVTLTNTVYTQNDGGNSTFTNVHFAAGFREGYGSGVKFTDCTFGSNAEGYALHFQSAGDSTNAIELNGCKFEGGKVHLGKGRTYAFTNCDFAAGTDFQIFRTTGTLEGCTVDGVAITAENIKTFFPDLKLENVTIDGAYVAATSEALKAVNGGNVNLVGTVDFAGEQGNYMTLTSDTTVTGGTIKGTGWTGEMNYAVNATSGNVVFDGVTFDTTDWSTVGWANWGISVNVNGTANVTFKDCTFKGAQCPIYLSGADAVVTLENCTFTGGYIQCEIYSGDFQLGQDLIVKNCDFTGMADVLHIYDYDKDPTSDAIAQYLTDNGNTFTGTCKQTCK